MINHLHVATVEPSVCTTERTDQNITHVGYGAVATRRLISVCAHANHAP